MNFSEELFIKKYHMFDNYLNNMSSMKNFKKGST